MCYPSTRFTPIVGISFQKRKDYLVLDNDKADARRRQATYLIINSIYNIYIKEKLKISNREVAN